MTYRLVKVYGHERFVKLCQCDQCDRARAVLADAAELVRGAKRRLRAHARRSRARPLTPQESAAKAFRRWDAQHPCERCGKLPGGHKSCGIAVRAGRPDRAAHARLVSAGKAAAQRRRAHESAPADALSAGSPPAGVCTK